MKAATMALGGAIGAVVAVPLVRYLLFPVGRKVVTSGTGPVDLVGVDALQAGAPPVRLQVTASQIRDAWAVADDVALGAAWVRRTEAGEVEALSSVCPHLGCAVDFDPGEGVFKCPCHKSSFRMDGEKISGPSKRGLDPLPVAVEEGRVKITFVRYRPDVPEREPV
ncbi:ubiquinol-cytochrome c reductase iron-sulfur subunit [Haliangium sp.]|uniref:QcrA and Rieske domain-containing protein n=1 Tax=Haliangium sp. TaxID=2663208 RepID=UPI003D0D155B